MPYEIVRHTTALVWVTIHGKLTMQHAEQYLSEMWQTLDRCPRPTDLLVDGRRIEDSPHTARQRSEQVIHHPHLGHIAFIVSHQHLLFFAPLMHMVSGIGMFGNEREALEYLSKVRNTPVVGAQRLPNMPPRPDMRPHQPAGNHSHNGSGARNDPGQLMFRSLGEMMGEWNRNLRGLTEDLDRQRKK